MDPALSLDQQTTLLSLILGGVWLFSLVIYLYTALCLYKIAQKTNTPNAWMAWIPIVQYLTMLEIAKKPTWWIILMLIPLVNIVIMILVMLGLLETLKRPWWYLLLMMVPLVNLVIWGILAFSKSPISDNTSPSVILPPTPPISPAV